MTLLSFRRKHGKSKKPVIETRVRFPSPAPFIINNLRRSASKSPVRFSPLKTTFLGLNSRFSFLPDHGFTNFLYKRGVQVRARKFTCTRCSLGSHQAEAGSADASFGQNLRHSWRILSRLSRLNRTPVFWLPSRNFIVGMKLVLGIAP